MFVMLFEKILSALHIEFMRNNKSRNNNKSVKVWIVIAVVSLFATIISYGQYTKSELPPPPPAPEESKSKENTDSNSIIYKVSPTIPMDYEDYKGLEYAADLRTPSNIKTEAEFDQIGRAHV